MFEHGQLLADLVAIDTISARSNLPFIAYVERYLEAHACAVERIEDAAAQKASLWITIGPRDVPGYVLSGHCDVVPVAGQAWSGDPFHLRRVDGRLIGRGATDMKGFLAVCLGLVPRMAAAPLKRPIHIAISYDEEVGCLGVRPLLAAIAGRTPKPLGCFVGEPTGMDVVTAHKGKRAFRTSVVGLAGHSSLAPRFVNAVEWGAQLVEHIRRTSQALAASGAREAGYDVPFTTLVTGMMAGGTAVNVVPASCTLEWECRTIAADEATGIEEAVMAYAAGALEPGMSSVSPRARITFEETISYPGLSIDPGHALVALARRLAGSDTLSKVAFGTEAGLFASLAGIPAVVVGPGSIAQAHQPDEFVEEEQLARCCRFVAALIDHCSSSG